MRADEREFIKTRFEDMKLHFTSLFDKNSKEHVVIQTQVSKNTKFRLISTGAIVTITFFVGSYGFWKLFFGGN